MKVRAGDVELSIIGPGDGWGNSPAFGDFARAFERLREALMPELPSTNVHGDGKDTWEVAAYDAAKGQGSPVYVEPFREYLMPAPLTNDQYVIYGHVPTQVILDYIEAAGGDGGEFRAFVEQTRDSSS